MEWNQLSIPKLQLCKTVWEWIGDFIPHFTGYVGIYPCWDWSQSMSVKMVCMPSWHYSDIMSAIVSQITGVSIVYSILLSGRRSKKTSKLRVTSFCEENSQVSGEFLAQRASNAENVSIWWRHHGRQGRLYSALSLSWLLVPWQCKVNSHQQPWCWPCSLGIFGSNHQKYQLNSELMIYATDKGQAVYTKKSFVVLEI